MKNQLLVSALLIVGMPSAVLAEHHHPTSDVCLSTECRLLEYEVYESEVVEIKDSGNPISGNIYYTYKGEDSRNNGVGVDLPIVKFTDSASLSVRTRGYFDGNNKPQLRTAATIDGKLTNGLVGYVGGGVQQDFETDETSGLVTGGLDFTIGEKFVIGVGGDLVTAGDDDLQGFAKAGFNF